MNIGLVFVFGILVSILLIAKKYKMDFLHMFLPLIRGKFSIDEDGNLYASEAFKSKKWLGVLLQVLVFVFIILTFLEQGNWKFTDALIVSLPTYLALEWIVYLGLFIIRNGIVMFKKSKDLLILMLSTVAVIIFAIMQNGKESDLKFLLVVLVIINIIQTIGIMYKLCIKENDFLKNEFESVTTVKQIFVVLFVVMVHLCNFVIICWLFCNGKEGQEFLLRKDVAITKLEDIVYYVVVSYTTVGYGDIVPGNSSAQFVACIISLMSMMTTAVIIGKIIGAAISTTVNRVGMIKIKRDDVEELLKKIKDLLREKGDLVIAARNIRYMQENNISMDIIKDIIMSLKVSEYEISSHNAIRDNEILHIFKPEYKGEKYYLKISMVGESVYCLSFHDIESPQK